MNLYNFFKKLATIFEFLANAIQYANFNPKYYVYIPSREKPKYIHTSYFSAIQEARRLKNIVGPDENVLVIQIITELGSDIPF